jgi:hypothetical protein
MELCTTSIHSSTRQSHVLLPRSYLKCQGFARSTSLVSQKRRRSKLYVLNAVTTGPPPSLESVTQLSRTNDAAVKSASTNKPNSALEQLDIERGVRIPFRKYMPELVLQSTNLHVYWAFGFHENYCNHATSSIATSGIKSWD